jgi:POT family
MVGQVVCTKFLEPKAFWMAYLFPSCMFVISLVVFSLGYKYYIHVAPEGSIYARALGCIRYASKRKAERQGKLY